jgi:hypothetical protein
MVDSNRGRGNQRRNSRAAEKAQNEVAQANKGKGRDVAIDQDESTSNNQPSQINFASEFRDDEVQAPGGDAPDPNNYADREDDGFVKNIVAGGGHPDDGAFTPNYVNGVDHEELDEDAPETNSDGSPVQEEDASEEESSDDSN